MSEQRFTLDKVEKGNAIISLKISDSVTNEDYFIMTKDLYGEDVEEIVGLLNDQQATINQLQRKCFELEKDYLIETSDISDKIYLEDEIKKLKEQYGVIDDE